MYRFIFVFLALTSVRSAHVTVNVDTSSDTVSVSGDRQLLQNQPIPYESNEGIILYAHAQKATFTISYISKDAYLEITDERLEFGKWVKNNNCDLGTSPNGLKITRDNPVTIRTCGRENSPSGTEGVFFLRLGGAVDPDYKVSFDVPWGAGKNKFKLEGLKDDPDVMCEERPVSSTMAKNIRCVKV